MDRSTHLPPHPPYLNLPPSIGTLVVDPYSPGRVGRVVARCYADDSRRVCWPGELYAWVPAASLRVVGAVG